MIASEVWIMILARAIQGLGMAIVITAQPMYVSEISTDDTRGATGSLIQLSIALGILYVYSIGPYVSYQALQWFCIAVPICFAAIFAFMPESPYYYVSKKRLEDASKALQFLRGQSAEAVRDTLLSIENFVEETAQQKGTVKDIFKTAGNRKAFIISASLVIFQQISGNTAVFFNTQSIFESAETGLDAAISAIVVGLVQVLASGVTPLIVDRFGRKIILLVSSATMSISLYALGAYFFIHISGGNVSNMFWLPLTSLVINIVMYSVSFGALPLVVASEMFPANIKNLAFAIVVFTCLLTTFLITFFFPLLNDLGTHYVFWFFATCCLIAFVFISLVLFETKGLSFQEIQDKLNEKRNQ